MQDLHSTFVVPAVNPSSGCTPSITASKDFSLLADNGVVTTDLTGNAVFNLTTASFGGLTGNVTFAIDGISAISGAKATFSANPISSDGTSVLTINAATTTPAGTYAFTVIANNGNITRTVVLSVIVPTQTARLSALLLSFGNQTHKTSSAPQTVKLTNLGKTAMSMTSMKTSSGFSETNTCKSSLASGATCSISVTFTPGTVQSYTGSLTITDSGSTSPQVVTLTGTGT